VSFFVSASAGGATESPPSSVQGHAATLGRAEWRIRSDQRTAHARRRRGTPGQLRVTLRCAAKLTRAQLRACRRTPKQWAALRGWFAQYEVTAPHPFCCSMLGAARHGSSSSAAHGIAGVRMLRVTR
jgi:hypothetical protein